MIRILYTNDVHFGGTFEPHYPKTAVALPIFFNLLERRRAEFDLLIIGGDLVNSGSVNIEELVQFYEALEKTGIPFYAVAGNHDLATRTGLDPKIEEWENCSLEKTNFGKVFGVQTIRSTKMVEGLKLVFFSIRNEDPDGQLPWLEEELSDKVPSILFGHYPLVPTRKGGFCSQWGYKRIKDTRQSLIELIKKRDNQIHAYFSGHHHLNSRVKIGRTEQIVTGSLGLATCCYRIINITNFAIDISTHRLPGIPNWLDDVMNPDNSTDSDHETLELYHWGNEEERNFTIER